MLDLEEGYRRSRAHGRAALRAGLTAGAAPVGPVLHAVAGSAGDGGTWFAIAEGLLVLIDHIAEAWDEELEARGVAGLEEAVADAELAFRPIIGPEPPGALDIATADALALAVHELEEAGVPTVVVAVALLGSIDDLANETFDDFFAVIGRLTIEPGEAYPVAAHDPRLVMSTSASTDRRRRPSKVAVRRAHHIRLGEARHRTYRLTLDWSLRGRLASLATPAPTMRRDEVAPPSLRIATIHVHTADDFPFAAGDAPHKIRNIGPGDASASAATHARLLLDASSTVGIGVACADVVVIPEYALTADQRPVVEEAFLSANGVHLLVAGSALVDGDINEGYLVVGGPVPTSEARTIEKFTPAEPFGITEQMTTKGRPSVTIWRSGTLALVVLICRDAADEDAITLLADAGTNLCLVPSFTDRFTTLATVAHQLTIRSQAWVAVAATPRNVDPDGRALHEASFSGPIGDDLTPVVFAVPGAGGNGTADLPGLWVYDTRSAGDLDDVATTVVGAHVRFIRRSRA